MTNREIREVIELTAANCIHSLTLLASRIEGLDDVDETDVRIIQDAAKDVAGVLTHLMDDFCDEPAPNRADFSPHLVAALHAHGWIKKDV